MFDFQFGDKSQHPQALLSDWQNLSNLELHIPTVAAHVCSSTSALPLVPIALVLLHQPSWASQGPVGLADPREEPGALCRAHPRLPRAERFGGAFPPGGQAAT